MRKTFNVTGSCFPDEHYMVRIDERLFAIRQMVEQGYYFVINRGRQYGKTTTLQLLGDSLAKDYSVLSLDFQELGTSAFRDEATFCEGLIKSIWHTVHSRCEQLPELDLPILADLREAVSLGNTQTLVDLFVFLCKWCEEAPKPIVLIIDEVDAASNNQVFLDFLSQLRYYYLNRRKKKTFHSVILASVYDIKNLKLKIRPEADHQYNSPWNIARPFDLDMSLSKEGIAEMLQEYEADHQTGMDACEVAGVIREYTAGYPVLVSTICDWIDRRGGRDGFTWDRKGVEAVVKRMIVEPGNLLLESMTRQMDAFPRMRQMLEDLVYQGERIACDLNYQAISLGLMFGYLKEEKGSIFIANRIFEMYWLNTFLAEERQRTRIDDEGQRNVNQFTVGGRLNIDLVMTRFVQYYKNIYTEQDAKFLERHGRKLFLLYLKPIINGVGNYYLEAETRDRQRTDVVVDYLGEQFVVELKIWHGDAYNSAGEEQLSTYLDRFGLKKGYLLTFSFVPGKEVGMQNVLYKDKLLVEAVV